jgi:hypothetical protein
MGVLHADVTYGDVIPFHDDNPGEEELFMAYFIVRERDGTSRFTAPWGEPMIARPGDALVRSPRDAADTYRIAAAAFACTYEILQRAP